MKTIKSFLPIFPSVYALHANTPVELIEKAKSGDSLGAQILKSQRSVAIKGLIPKLTYYHHTYFWI